MLFSYEDCIRVHGNDYQIKQMLRSEILFKLEPGVYSDQRDVRELEVILFRYPNAVITMDNAFYYHGLTDTIPDGYCLATGRNAPKIRDIRVRQMFEPEDRLPIGKSRMAYCGMDVVLYDKERMLIELIRRKKKLPFDYYKEIISSYRKLQEILDIEKVQEYLNSFPIPSQIFKAIQLEVL